MWNSFQLWNKPFNHWKCTHITGRGESKEVILGIPYIIIAASPNIDACGNDDKLYVAMLVLGPNGIGFVWFFMHSLMHHV
jgi:hypothetical protein